VWAAKVDGDGDCRESPRTGHLSPDGEGATRQLVSVTVVLMTDDNAIPLVTDATTDGHGHVSAGQSLIISV